MKLDFVKAHGTGNDFVVFEDFSERIDLTSEAVRALCDRRFGIGADGIIRITTGIEAPYRMEYRNSDGSAAEMCGNGVRVVGKWLGDRGLAQDIVELETGSGVKRLGLSRTNEQVTEVTVDMGAPLGDVIRKQLSIGDDVFDVILVSMGNPHAVLFVDDVESARVQTLGPLIEHHTEFPERTNVEFASAQGDVLLQRTWERGSGETLACGTGACAVLVAAATNGLTGRTSAVELRGGTLRLEWTENCHVLMTGPAVEVFSGSIETAAFGVKYAGMGPGSSPG